MQCTDAALAKLATELGSLLDAGGRTVTAAESCTGGWIAKAITDIAGSSAWFGAGFVTYSNAAKTQMLGVPAELIESHGAVSQPVAAAMAEGARRVACASIAVAVTGIAGPDGGTPAKPVGTVWLAWATRNQTRTLLEKFAGDREAVRRQTVARALNGLLGILAEAE